MILIILFRSLDYPHYSILKDEELTKIMVSVKDNLGPVIVCNINMT